MNAFIIFMLIGFASGLIIFPIILLVYIKIKNAKERRTIKRMMKKGQMLIPIDPKDYNVEAWKNQEYGNINPEDNKEILENLNLKIFKKPLIEDKKLDEKPEEKKHEVSELFVSKAKEYLLKARGMGYTDSQITDEFKKKNYSEELINKIFEYGKPKSIN